jgi:AmmeMemoRadiSam system protein B/AmmeMemoRadiSam system protein A
MGGGVHPGAVRPAAVAGLFYPSDADELSRMVDGLIANAEPPALDNVLALVAPHAGYIYSGSVAAHAYGVLQGRKFERVVVIAPAHYEAFRYASVYDGAAYSTPLGRIPVDHEFAAQLAQSTPAIRLSAAGHTPTGDRAEHAVEVHLPFLQRTLANFALVPIVMGDQRYEACRSVGTALAEMLQGTQSLIVASSDLSHFHSYREAITVDHKTLHLLEQYDYLNLSHNLEMGAAEACGGGPVVAAMIAAERLGATCATVLRYANSGDTAGDKQRVVGYAAAALWNAPATADRDDAVSLSQSERDALIDIARRSVEDTVRGSKSYRSSSGGLQALERECGVFVTLTNRGRLRGCIGNVTAVKALHALVCDLAALAATNDPRFRPVDATELPDLEYEISVLSPLRRVGDVREIQVGRDGLLIRMGARQGVLLPQVAAQRHWDAATFLEQTCGKAGLPLEAWQDPAADLFRFTASVFGGHEPRPGSTIASAQAEAGAPGPALTPR